MVRKPHGWLAGGDPLFFGRLKYPPALRRFVLAQGRWQVLHPPEKLLISQHKIVCGFVLFKISIFIMFRESTNG
jgi:hypothetical protein